MFNKSISQVILKKGLRQAPLGQHHGFLLGLPMKGLDAGRHHISRGVVVGWSGRAEHGVGECECVPQKTVLLIVIF